MIGEHIAAYLYRSHTPIIEIYVERSLAMNVVLSKCVQIFDSVRLMPGAQAVLNAPVSMALLPNILHDPLAMVVAVDPSVVNTRKMVTRIECGGTWCRGKVVVDLREQPIEGKFVNHCLEVDSRKALNILFAAFQR